MKFMESFNSFICDVPINNIRSKLVNKSDNLYDTGSCFNKRREAAVLIKAVFNFHAIVNKNQ